MSTSEARTPRAYDAVERLGTVEDLDRPAAVIAKAIRERLPKPAKDALSGDWLGHALHPVLTDVPIGTWTSALLLDWIGGRHGEEAAERLIAVGLTAAAPTFASGWVDWAYSTAANPLVRRVGIVHAVANGGGTALMGASLVARRRGNRGRGKALALAAGGLMGVGAYLGGHLSFAEGIGVDQTAFEAPPDDWAAVMSEAELADGRPRAVKVGDVAVLVVRHQGELHALSDRCSHRGGALHEGEIVDGCVKCPLHGSVFALRDGSVRGGPSPYPQPLWETRVRDGQIELRPAGTS
jgi:nitrite reductase/ring-hydroxylating ferredoxin subunit/uncharacterized membrane protein